MYLETRFGDVNCCREQFPAVSKTADWSCLLRASGILTQRRIIHRSGRTIVVGVMAVSAVGAEPLQSHEAARGIVEQALDGDMDLVWKAR